jgi:hypothetical protein
VKPGQPVFETSLSKLAEENPIWVGGAVMALSKTTQDHEEIRSWAEKRGAVPAEVASTHRRDEPGILRFSFPRARDKNNDKLTEVSWDDFFEKFDENNLELVYQEKTAAGRQSNFNKLIHPGSSSRGKTGSSSRTARSSRSGSRNSESRSAANRSHRRAA